MRKGDLILVVIAALGVLFFLSRGALAEQPSITSSSKPANTSSAPPSSAPPPAVDSPKGGAAAAAGETTTQGLTLGTPYTHRVTQEQGELLPLEKRAAQQESAAESVPQPFKTGTATPFGYNFFRTDSAGFAPLTDVPVGPDYVIGPGDKIILRLWGSVESSSELEVNRSGDVFLPKVGSVKVWGVSFARLPEVLKRALGKVHKDFDLDVSLGKLRVIKVFVVGEVNAPGAYVVSPFSTLINALSAAGGPLPTGTLRNIQIKRNGKIVETVDLYDFFLRGDKSRDIRLQPADTIFVPVIGSVAGISGNVKRPATYELRGERTLDELIALAEGFLSTGYLQRVQISRVVAHEKKVVVDFNVDPAMGGRDAAGIPVQDLDLVTVFPIDASLRAHVRLGGHVLRPGDYALQPGMRLSQLLLPDNLLQECHDTVEVTRLHPPDYHPEVLYLSLARILAGDLKSDRELNEFDRVRIFSRWEMEEMPTVRVNGEVQRPGEYRLLTNMTVHDLIMKAGNLRITADTSNAEISRITRIDGKAKAFPIVVNLDQAINGNPKDDILLAPLDELTVRKIPNWTEEKERYVTLVGEVRYPGVYPIYKSERMSSVLERAGGFTDQAYLRGARFTRVSVQQDQQKRMDEVLGRTEKEILRKQAELTSLSASKEELEATRASLEGLMKSLEKVKAAKAEGRMVIRLAPLAEMKNGPYDLELRGGDTLQVPPMPKSVNVMGEVYNPTTLVCNEVQSAGYYLDQAGGPTREAERGDMYIIMADGSILSRQQFTLGLFSNDGAGNLQFGTFLSTRLISGDTLVVPQKLERVAWIREIKDITTILSQIALSAGIVLAAGL